MYIVLNHFIRNLRWVQNFLSAAKVSQLSFAVEW